MSPLLAVSSVATIGHNSNAVTGDDDHEEGVNHDHNRNVVIANSISVSKTEGEAFKGDQHERRNCMAAIHGGNSRIDRLLAGKLGYHLGLDESVRKAIFRKARKYRVKIEAGGDQPHPGTHRACVSADLDTLAELNELIKSNAKTRKVWEGFKGKIEKRMKKRAKALPIFQWVKTVRGMGPLGLGILFGEARDPIASYQTVAKLWYRCCFAVFDGRRQRLVRGKEEAKRQGYSPQRHGQIWTVLCDSLFKGQWIGDRDEDGKRPAKSGKPVAVAGHAKGPYGELYAYRRAHTWPRVLRDAHLDYDNPDKWTPRRCDRDARRYMAKAFLRDLWRVSRGLPAIGVGTCIIKDMNHVIKDMDYVEEMADAAN